VIEKARSRSSDCDMIIRTGHPRHHLPGVIVGTDAAQL
jgi:hypothetical protein